MKSVFEKYLSNTPKYANQIQIQIQIFHLAGFQIQIQIQIFAYLNTNTNTNTYLTPALIYVQGKIEGIDTVHTVDTGTSTTLVSTRLLEQIPEHRRPTIDRTKCPNFIGPTGGAIDVLGKAKLQMSIGLVKITREVSVSKLFDDCLLGADILLGLDEGSFDFQLSKNQLVWNGFTIPCIQVTPHSAYKVKCVNDCTVDGYSERLIDAVFQTSIEDTDSVVAKPPREVVIEHCGGFHDRKRLFMASSLASLSKSNLVKVRVVNPFAQDITIKDGEVMGRASMFDSVIPLFSEEKRGSENAEAVRHVPVKDKDDVDSLCAGGFPEEVELDPEDSVTVPLFQIFPKINHRYKS